MGTLVEEQTRAQGAGDAEAADVALAASGDASAFERLYHAHVPRIHALVRRMIDVEEADDVTQDIFVRAWSRLKSFRGESAFGTWLYRLALNVILARRKTVGVERSRFDDREHGLAEVTTRRIAPEISLDFAAAVERLPDGARQVFVLHDIEGYTHEEIGEMLGVVAGTSKSQLHHARMALRQYLKT